MLNSGRVIPLGRNSYAPDSILMVSMANSRILGLWEEIGLEVLGGLEGLELSWCIYTSEYEKLGYNSFFRTLRE